MGFVNRSLGGIFHSIGYKIGKRPYIFLIGSIIASIGFGSGILWSKYENSEEVLFRNTNGPAESDKQIIDTLFPQISKGAFDPGRLHRVGRFARLIIVAKDGGTLLRKSVWTEILELDQLIHKVSFKWKNTGFQNYSKLCGRWNADCYENSILELGQVIEQIENGSLSVSYPIMLNPETFSSHAVALNFGGITLSNDSTSILGVEAVGLNYFVAVDSDEDDSVGYEWEGQILDTIEKSLPDWKEITVYRYTHKSLSREQDVGAIAILPNFCVNILAMGLFLTATSMSTDWVRAKPWAASFGMICATLGSFAGIGLMCFIGVPLISLSAAVPFIMLGIGIDDTFVILAAWRQTNPTDSVPKRLAACYAEAGVSITITTLTDMLSFYVGIMTPIPSVQIFSAYAGTCILWIYIMQLTLFGGILAISGRQEAENQHALFCWRKATPKSKSGGRSKMFRLFCAGGIDKFKPDNEQDRSESSLMLFFRDGFSTFLTKTWVKVSVILVFIVYLASSGYGLTTMEEGLQIKRIYREDSYLYEYLEKESQYFHVYPYRIQVLITSPLDYSNQTVQTQVYSMLEQMTNSSHMTHEYSENWLKSFTRYTSGYELNVSNEQNFIDTLQSDYLNGSVFQEDVKFNDEGTQIKASRFIIQTTELPSYQEEKELVTNLRSIAENQQGFNVTVYHPWFHFVDQYLIIRELTVKLIATASAIVMLVAIIFIPNFVCSVAVFVTIGTIEIGVMGFMCLWGISLDILSLICLIMCIGFSVDFAAHVSYAYISAEGSSEDRIRKALYSLGLPVVQGGLSTIIGISGLFFVPAYSSNVFAKVVTIVILFAMFHGLFVLPVFLLIIRPERFSWTSATIAKTYMVTTTAAATNLKLKTLNG